MNIILLRKTLDKLVNKETKKAILEDYIPKVFNDMLKRIGANNIKINFIGSDLISYTFYFEYRNEIIIGKIYTWEGDLSLILAKNSEISFTPEFVEYLKRIDRI